MDGLSEADLAELAQAIAFSDPEDDEDDEDDDYAEQGEGPKLLTPSDVLDMAAYLGIDTNEELWLLPLARDAVLAELPAGWVEKIDSNGEPYYIDSANGVTTSEHPTDNFYLQKVIEARKVGPPAKASKWMEFVDENNRVFYYNFKRNTARYADEGRDPQLAQQQKQLEKTSSTKPGKSKFSELRDLPMEAGDGGSGSDGEQTSPSPMMSTTDISAALGEVEEYLLLQRTHQPAGAPHMFGRS